eukprot:XP_016659915.1 PREDICTED: protein ROP-like [Acyrthosiphon pisum]
MLIDIRINILLNFNKACPEKIFKFLSKSLPKKKILSFQEIDIAFIPFESQVFSLDSRITFQACFNSLLESTRIPHLETLAFQIASVCYALNEYPSVRYIKRSNNKNTKDLAQLVLGRLDELKKYYQGMGDGFEKDRSQLIIIDRSFDWTSLILHELTFQAMAHDNFTIKNNVFRFTENGAQKEVVFDDRDEVCAELRHQHIYNAADAMRFKLKNCVDSGLASTVDVAQSTSLAGLSYVIKKIPQQQKIVDNYSRYMSALKQCVDFYGKHLEDICIFEQDLAMGKEAVEDKITYDVKKKLISFLMDNNVSIQNKIRLIILYILFMNGVSEDIFNELVNNAQLSPADVQTILNLKKLGVTTDVDENNKKHTVPRKDRVDENTFQVSRWTPKIKDILEYCIENHLDPDEFPYVSVREHSTEKYKASSSRYNATWYKGKYPKKEGSRIILFIIGGVTYSEMRSVYEVSKNFKNWNIIIGSSHIMTPEDFLKDLSDLSEH